VGPSYAISYKILVILIVPTTFALVQGAAYPLLLGISKHKFIAYLNTFEGVTNLILSIILVKKFGIIGVALGTAIPMIVTKLFIHPVYLAKTLKVNFENYINAIFGPLIKTFIALIIPWFVLSRFLRPDYKSLFILGLIQTLIFLVIVFLFGFPENEKNYILRLLRVRK
jgi:O-antigen/teichoic acid export membrane protein